MASFAFNGNDGDITNPNNYTPNGSPGAGDTVTYLGGLMHGTLSVNSWTGGGLTSGELTAVTVSEVTAMGGSVTATGNATHAVATSNSLFHAFSVSGGAVTDDGGQLQVDTTITGGANAIGGSITAVGNISGDVTAGGTGSVATQADIVASGFGVGGGVAGGSIGAQNLTFTGTQAGLIFGGTLNIAGSVSWTAAPQGLAVFQGGFTIALGGVATIGSMTLGNVALVFNEITVQDSGSQLHVTSSLILGDAGRGRLLVSGGGGTTLNNAVIGENTGGDGRIRVTGNGSSLVVATLAVAREGAGTFEVFNGGHADVTGSLLVGQGTGFASTSTTGTVNVNGSGSKLTAHNMTLGAAALVQTDACHEWQYSFGGKGTLTVANHGRAEIADTLLLNNPSLDGTTVIINTAGGMDVGGTGAADDELWVHGGGTMKGHGTIMVGDQSGGPATFGSITNDGVIEAFEGRLILQANVTSSGTLRIDDAAILQLDGDLVGAHIQFNGGLGTRLVLNSSTQYQSTLTGLEFKGTIGGLANGNIIEFGADTWGGRSFAHNEIVGSELVSTTSNGDTVVFHLTGSTAGHVFSILDTAAFFYADASPKVITHVDGTPTNGANPYIDSLIQGWAAWDPAQPITYWFGSASDVHAAIDIHGESVELDCDNPQVTAWNAAQQAAFLQALAAYEATTNLSFQPAASVSDANIVWWLTPSLSTPGAVAQSETPAMRPDGHLWQFFVASDLVGITPGGYGFETLVHELGHSLGLAHPHDGGSEPDANVFPGVTETPTGGTIGDFGQNQTVYSTMSYNIGWTGQPTSGKTFGDQASLGALDIAALQILYGPNATYNTGDNYYALPSANAVGTGWRSIWDADGIDTISAAGSNLAATIDLREAPLIGAFAGGYVSWIHGIQGGFTIAHDVIIEKAIGGNSDDILTGNDHSNYLDGGLGSDHLTGGGGKDTFVYDGNGLDTIADFGAGGTDDVVRVTGVYTSFVQLQSHIASINGGADTRIDFGGGRGLVLTGYSDPLEESDFEFASGGPEIAVSFGAIGIADDSTITALADGTDFGTAAIGEVNEHTFTIGNEGVQSLTVSNLKLPKGYVLVEGILSPIAPGASDTFTVRIDTKKIGVKAGAITFTTNDADEGSFNFNITGNVVKTIPGPDVSGDNSDNELAATAFAEKFLGMDGIDIVSYATQPGPNGVVASLLGQAKNSGFAADDSYDSIEGLRGSDFNDTLTGDAGDNILEGGPGADKLDGGLGSDTASYQHAAGAVTADLSKSGNNLGEAQGDTYKSVENLTGSDFDDTLVGDKNANILAGGLGSDIFRFNAAKDGGPTGDVIADFGPGDHIGIVRKGFKIAAGVDLNTGDDLDFGTHYFVSGDGSAPITLANPSGIAPLNETGHGQFLFNEASHQLWWDPDGAGSKAALLLATFLNGALIGPNDFVLT